MVRIKITKAEIAAQSLTDEHLQSALASMDRDGVVVLENAIPVDIVDRLGDKMRDDMAAVKKVRSIAEKSSNESLAPPLNHPWVFREICYNEFAIQIWTFSSDIIRFCRNSIITSSLSVIGNVNT